MQLALCSEGSMNKIINALYWGVFLFALAVCSAWCWVKEKIKGK